MRREHTCRVVGWTLAIATGFIAPGGAASGQVRDSAIEIAAGGLILVNNPALRIEAKELVVKPDRIRATYVIRNTSTRSRTVLVAFPLPDIDTAAIGDEHIRLAQPQAANFVDAAITADGAPVEPGIEQRAVAFGLDVTVALETAQVPLPPFALDMAERLARLPPAVRTDLAERGIVRLDVNRVHPNWTLKTTAHWRQEFQPGRAVTLTLTYMPVVAQAPFAAALIDQLRKSHCIEATVDAAITRKVVASAGKVTFQWLSFALTSGSGWSGPVGSFRLLVEKPSIDTIVSTCQQGLRSIGPTAIELTARDYQPDDDLYVLFIR